MFDFELQLGDKQACDFLDLFWRLAHCSLWEFFGIANVFPVAQQGCLHWALLGRDPDGLGKASQASFEKQQAGFLIIGTKCIKDV